jgi:hypothetical protein
MHLETHDWYYAGSSFCVQCPFGTHSKAMGATSFTTCTLLCNTVLLIHADSSTYAVDVQSNLQRAGGFSSVDLFDARVGTQSLGLISKYSSVLVWSEASQNFFDPVELGNILSSYFLAGGGVVIAPYGNMKNNLRGVFGTTESGYMLMDPAAGAVGPVDSMSAAFDTANPLFSGVSTISAGNAYHSYCKVINGGTTLATWGSDNQALVVKGIKDGRQIFLINMYQPSRNVSSNLWEGDGAALIRNVLQFASSVSCRCAPGQHEVMDSSGSKMCMGCIAGTFSTVALAISSLNCSK